MFSSAAACASYRTCSWLSASVHSVGALGALGGPSAMYLQSVGVGVVEQGQARCHKPMQATHYNKTD